MQTEQTECGVLIPFDKLLRQGCREAADLLLRFLLQAATDVHRR